MYGELQDGGDRAETQDPLSAGKHSTLISKTQALNDSEVRAIREPASFRQAPILQPTGIPLSAAYLILLLLLAGGFLTFTDNNVLPVAALMEVVALLAFCGAGLNRSGATVIAALGILLIASMRIVFAMSYGTASLYDALQAHKWVLFVGLLFLMGRAGPKSTVFISRTIKALVAADLLKVLLLHVVSPGNRLGILIETNFEITFYCELFAVFWSRLGAHRLLWLGALGIVTALSGSRSGSIAFGILLLYIVLSRRGDFPGRRFFRPVILTVTPLLVLWVFAGRGTDLQDTDRSHFLNVFLEAVNRWSAHDWIFGSPPLTPLPQNLCDSLSYYSTLFSTTGNGECYSVIVHIFQLRVIYDFGLVGLLAATTLPLIAMIRAKVHRPLALVLSGIAFANGLSVSGLNSEFIVIPMALAIAYAPSMNPTATGSAAQ